MTVHWPLTRNHQAHFGVWARARRNNALADKIRRGDIVAVYETRCNPLEFDDRWGEPGAVGVIGYGTVLRLYNERDDHGFFFRASLCKRVECHGATYAQLQEIIPTGFYPNFQGLREITENEFSQITNQY